MQRVWVQIQVMEIAVIKKKGFWMYRSIMKGEGVPWTSM